MLFLTALGQSGSCGWQGVWLCHKYGEVCEHRGEAATWCSSEAVVLYQIPAAAAAAAGFENPKPLLISPCPLCYLCSSPSFGWLQFGSAFEGRCWWGGTDAFWVFGVTDISSGLSGIMKLPCQIWICPGSEGYDSYCVSRELFGSFNCLLFNSPWNVNLERICVHEGDV